MIRTAFFLGLLFWALPSNAKHLIGGSMTYEYVQTNPDGRIRWKFKLILYRDCENGGAPFDLNANIGVYRGKDLYSYKTIPSPVIEKVGSGCDSWPNGCYEKGTYVFTENLPPSGELSYYVIYQRCCFTPDLSNVATPEEVGFTIQAELTPAAMALKSNSPVLEGVPPFIATKDGYRFKPYFKTAPGNRLSFRLAGPFKGGGPILGGPAVSSCVGAIPMPPCPPPYQSVPWLSGYAETHPFASDDAIDTSSGVFTVTPSLLGRYVVGMAVDQYADTAFISTTHLYFSVTVVDSDQPCAPLSAHEGNSRLQSLRIAPTPLGARSRMILDSAPDADLQMRVFDMYGRSVYTRTWPAAAVALELPSEAWPSGAYMVELRKGHAIYARQKAVRQ